MTKFTLDLAAVLKKRHPKGFHAPADLDIDTFLEFADDDWTHELDVHDLLAERRQIADVWGTEDVRSVRPDLTADQAWEVLRAVKRYHDDQFGITWEVLDHHAESLYPEPEPKTFEVTVVARTKETYRVEAVNAELAEEWWAEGRLVRTDDTLDSEVLTVTEVQL